MGSKMNYKKAENTTNQDKLERYELSRIKTKPKFGYAERNINFKKPPLKEYKEKCPQCGCKLYIKNGKFGEFVGCINYPKCRYTQ